MIKPPTTKWPGDLFQRSADFEQAVAAHGDAAARSHLEKGQPVYYADARYPGYIVKKNPDGSQQLVLVEANGNITVVRTL